MHPATTYASGTRTPGAFPCFNDASFGGDAGSAKRASAARPLRLGERGLHFDRA
jgi:hypothetical protein